MKKKILSSLILIIVCCNMTVYSFATSVDDLQNQKNDLENQKSEAEEKLDEVKTQKSETLGEIQELTSQIQGSEDDLEKYNSQVKELELSISNSEKQIQEAEENYNKQKEMLEARIIAQYKNGKTSYLDVLLNSTSLSSFISRYFLVGKVAKADSELMQEITKQKEAIEKEKEKMEQEKSEVKIAKANAEKENVKLKNAKAQKNSKVAKLSTEEKAIQEEIEEFEVESKRISETIKQYSKNNNDVYSGGQLNWPVPSSKNITSPYGYRIHPLTGTSKLHTGIDIGGSKGASIVAAEDGTVIKVVSGCTHNYGKNKSCGCGGGYGNYLIISHGSGLATIYAHCTAINVSVGSKVKREQTIATVGSTGSSTGFHCHFEVQVNGIVKNPSDYL